MRTIAAVALACLFILSAFVVHLPSGSDAAQGKKDAGGYQYTDGKDPEPKVDCNYVSVSDNPKKVGLDTSNWGAVITVNLPFSFTYYDASYTKVHISSYGAMSFTDTSGFDYYYSSSIPSSQGPRGVLAVYWTWASDCYDTSKSRLLTLTTKVDDEDAFIVEWNPTNGGKFEAILFKSGAIKYQYQSVPNTWGGGTGSYTTIGIERPDDQTGVLYTGYQYYSTDLFPLPFAIMFHKDDILLTNGRLENGDGSDRQLIYPGSKDYIFSVEAFHTSGWSSISSVMITLGPGDENVKLVYWLGNRTFAQLSGAEYAGMVMTSPVKDGPICTAAEMDFLTIKITFVVDFMLTYPTSSADIRNFTFFANGKSAVPIRTMADMSYRIERGLEWSSDTVMIRLPDKNGQKVDYNGYVPAQTRVQFHNLRVYYDKSQVQPRAGVVMVNVTDQNNILKRIRILPGQSMVCDWTTADESTVMIFTVKMSDVPKECILSEPLTFQIKVDSEDPNAPERLEVRPDSLEGNVSNIDDDYRVYLSWTEPEDNGGSGIGGYQVEATGPNGFHRKRETSEFELSYYLGNKVGDELPEGIINVSVRAIDKVDNLGPPSYVNVIIDQTGPYYEIVDPLPGTWVKGTKPHVQIKVADALTAIDGMELTYRVSKDGGYTWGGNQNCNYFGQEETTVIVNIEPELAEGRNNLIEIIGWDMAHSKQTSAQFPVLVDARAPKVSLIDVPMEEDGRTTAYIADPSARIKISVHDFLGSGLDLSRLTFRYSTDNGTTFSSDIPMDVEPFNNSQGFSEVQYIVRKDWAEGDVNLLVVEASDKVGKNTTATFRLRMDMTPEIDVLEPMAGSTFLDNQTITFEATVIDPDGTGTPSISWTSNIQGILGSGPSVQAVLQAGEHIISLIVKDKAHTLVRTFTLNIKSYLLEDPYLKDTDGDGMSDGYEDDYASDPLVVGSKGLDKKRDDASEDLDGDGFTNFQEYLSGTNPLVKGSHPGSSLVEERFPVLPIVLMVVGILLVLVMGMMTVMESRKAPEYAPQAPPARYPPGMPGYAPQALMPPQMQSLPPAPMQYAGPPQ